MSKKNDEFSNNPFASAVKDLKGKLRDLEQEEREKAEVARVEAKEAARRRAEMPLPEEDDATIFRRHMSGVQPLEAPDYVAPENRGEPPREYDDDAEAMAMLADLVSGEGLFDISDSDEFMEGIAHGLDRRLLRKLRRGFFSVQAHLDLHGLTRVEAKDEVAQFLRESRLQGRRCVLLVHGRGHNSKDQVPVLKEALKVWLARGSLARKVLAFCTAQPTDGGAGAVYVLLRK